MDYLNLNYEKYRSSKTKPKEVFDPPNFLENYYGYPTTINGDIVMGDKIIGDSFKNLENSTIINKSTLKSFNQVNSKDNREFDKALLQIAEFLNKNKNHGIDALQEEFFHEVRSSHPNKSTLKNVWKKIEMVLPTISTLSETLDKILSLIKD